MGGLLALQCSVLKECAVSWVTVLRWCLIVLLPRLLSVKPDEPHSNTFFGRIFHMKMVLWLWVIASPLATSFAESMSTFCGFQCLWQSPYIDTASFLAHQHLVWPPAFFFVDRYLPSVRPHIDISAYCVTLHALQAVSFSKLFGFMEWSFKAKSVEGSAWFPILGCLRELVTISTMSWP